MSDDHIVDANKLVAPFPYFGGKRSVAEKVWAALGEPRHYIEPFFGSGAVLLLRPDYDRTKHIETICDKDGHIANVWRALRENPDEVAQWCDWPVNHADLSARRIRLIENMKDLLPQLIADDTFYDAKMAGYWIWAASCWIGSGLTLINARPNIGDAGQGVHKISQRPHLSGAGKGVHKINANIYEWFRELSDRLRYVRVVCGDWTRVCGGNWQAKMGLCGIFFDPPYGVVNRDQGIYAEESTTVAHDVMLWAAERGSRPDHRIVIAGYEEHMPLVNDHGWTCESWKAAGGYANTGNSRGKENCKREVLYYSPHCLNGQDLSQGVLFA